MGKCFIKQCKHYNLKHMCKFYTFPKHAVEYQNWIKITGCGKPYLGARVCSCHFKNGLKENGPTLLLGECSNNQTGNQNMELDEKKRQNISEKSVIEQKVPTATRKSTNTEGSVEYGKEIQTSNEDVKMDTTSSKNEDSNNIPTITPAKFEYKLARGIKILQKWGFVFSKSDIITLASRFSDYYQLTLFSKNNLPDEQWYKDFVSKYRLRVKNRSSIEFKRKKRKEPLIINDCFSLLKETMADEDQNSTDDAKSDEEMSDDKSEESFSNVVKLKQSGVKQLPKNELKIVQIPSLITAPPFQGGVSEENDDSEPNPGVASSPAVLDDEDVFEVNSDDPLSISVGNYILVKFSDTKFAGHHVGKIIKITEKGYKTKFLRKMSGNKFHWPVVEDVWVIRFSNSNHIIERILPPPEENRWGVLYFDRNCLYGYNIA